MANFDEDLQSDNIEDRRGDAPMSGAESEVRKFGAQAQVAAGKVKEAVSPTPERHAQDKMESDVGLDDVGSNTGGTDQNFAGSGATGEYASGGAVKAYDDGGAIPDDGASPPDTSDQTLRSQPGPTSNETPAQQTSTQQPSTQQAPVQQANEGAIPEPGQTPGQATQQSPQGGETDTNWRPAAIDAVMNGLKYGHEKYGVESAQTQIPTQDEPQRMGAYLQGEGAIPPEQMDQAEKSVDPDGSMHPAERRLRTVGQIAQQAGDQFAEAAHGALQHYRKVFDTFAAHAVTALGLGHDDNAAKLATEALNAVPGPYAAVVTHNAPGNSLQPDLDRREMALKKSRLGGSMDESTNNTKYPEAEAPKEKGAIPDIDTETSTQKPAIPEREDQVVKALGGKAPHEALRDWVMKPPSTPRAKEVAANIQSGVDYVKGLFGSEPGKAPAEPQQSGGGATAPAPAPEGAIPETPDSMKKDAFGGSEANPAVVYPNGQQGAGGRPGAKIINVPEKKNPLASDPAGYKGKEVPKGPTGFSVKFLDPTTGAVKKEAFANNAELEQLMKAGFDRQPNVNQKTFAGMRSGGAPSNAAPSAAGPGAQVLTPSNAGGSNAPQPSPGGDTTSFQGKTMKMANVRPNPGGAAGVAGPATQASTPSNAGSSNAPQPGQPGYFPPGYKRPAGVIFGTDEGWKVGNAVSGKPTIQPPYTKEELAKYGTPSPTAGKNLTWKATTVAQPPITGKEQFQLDLAGKKREGIGSTADKQIAARKELSEKSTAARTAGSKETHDHAMAMEAAKTAVRAQGGSVNDAGLFLKEYRKARGDIAGGGGQQTEQPTSGGAKKAYFKDGKWFDASTHQPVQ